MIIGDIDVAKTIVDHEMKIYKLEKILEEALQGQKITQQDIEQAEQDALRHVQTVYPNMGITKQP